MVSYFEKEVKNELYRHIVKADLDSPRQELSNGRLGIAVPAQQVLSDTYFQPLLRNNVGHFSRLKITFFVVRIIKI